MENKDPMIPKLPEVRSARVTMTQRRQSRHRVGGIAIAILAVIAVSYFEYLVIDRAPAFAAACNLARSTDLKPVLDAGLEDAKVVTPAAH